MRGFKRIWIQGKESKGETSDSSEEALYGLPIWPPIPSCLTPATIRQSTWAWHVLNPPQNRDSEIQDISYEHPHFPKPQTLLPTVVLPRQLKTTPRPTTCTNPAWRCLSLAGTSPSIQARAYQSISIRPPTIPSKSTIPLGHNETSHASGLVGPGGSPRRITTTTRDSVRRFL